MKLTRKNAIRLVLIGGVATIASGCSPSNPPIREPMSRMGYQTKAECVKDWDESGCEGVSSSTGSNGSSGAHTWWGPYYSKSGTTYHYDGKTSFVDPKTKTPAITKVSHLAPEEVFASSAKYKATPPAASASPAKAASARYGGFGARSGGFSSGG